MKMRALSWILIAAAGLSACSPVLTAKEHRAQTETASAFGTLQAVSQGKQQQAERVTPGPTPVSTKTPLTPQSAVVWMDESIPEELRAGMQLTGGGRLTDSKADSNLQFGVVHYEQGAAEWVYALVEPFPTLLDAVSQADLRQAWRGEAPEAFGDHGLLMSPQTKAALEGLWGPTGEDVQILPEDRLLETAWSERTSSADPVLAIVPFETLEPRWKVVRIDGQSPLDKAFHPDSYPLVVRFGWTSPAPEGTGSFPTNNRDPGKLTTLVMTGVTALVRDTAARMEKNGMSYPGRDIVSWLRDADITHISNEVSFTPKCPPANPHQTALIFCSQPEYIQLLEYVGADVIELSGNHLLDWRWDALPYSFGLYDQHHMRYYASGNTPEEARQPLEIEHNGNRFVFIGCNPAGPKTDWVSDDHAGTSPCDVEWMTNEIGRRKADGQIPIVTLQYFENYSMKVQDHQEKYFHQFSDAGAVIVSGSQAHFPQGMELDGNAFIHYGLGNLFFDQMRLPDYAGVPLLFNEKDLPIPGTRLEFVDRHVFYNGRYLGVEVLTAMLEDYARPRPMTPEERSVFLRDTFKASGW